MEEDLEGEPIGGGESVRALVSVYVCLCPCVCVEEDLEDEPRGGFVGHVGHAVLLEQVLELGDAVVGEAENT